MLNFRKLKHDLPPAVLKDGKFLFDKGQVVACKIINLSPNSVRFSCQVTGNFENSYQSEIDIDRHESVIVDSDCDCPYKYDCQHLAAVIYNLEAHFNQILVAYSKENDLGKVANVDEKEKIVLREKIREAETKEHLRKDKKNLKALLEEYIESSKVLGQSSFFRPEEEIIPDKAELALIFAPPQKNAEIIEIQLALRLPFRSKVLNVPHIKSFLEAIRYREPIYIGSKRYYFTSDSFDEISVQVLKFIVDFARIPENKTDKLQRSAFIEFEAFGNILSTAFSLAEPNFIPLAQQDSEPQYLPRVYYGTIEEPLKTSVTPAVICFELEYLELPAPKIFLKPKIVLQNEQSIACEEGMLFESVKPGMLHQSTYYRFQPSVKRKHLRNLDAILNMTIPEPLFGTFVENALSELKRFAQVSNKEIIEKFVTLPFVEQVGAECDIHYLNGELEASLCFVYGNVKVPATSSQLTVEHISTFITKEGILARNLTEEQKIIDSLFQDFIFDPAQGLYSAKNEKKIVEFMTEVIPANQHRVKFNCPENLLDQFIYDDTAFTLNLRESNRVDAYEVELKVEGSLNGCTVELLWDCLTSKRAYIEIAAKCGGSKKKGKSTETKQSNKILVLDLDKLAPVVQIFDEIGLNELTDHVETRPLWSLAGLDSDHFKGLPIKFTMSEKLKEIQKQMLGQVPFSARNVPDAIQASLRNYQVDGIQWLHRLRSMYLNGILADDMGLGKTLQAIISLTQYKEDHPNDCSLVVCPTSLVYNWKEEIAKFNPKLRVLPVDGNPTVRKKLLTGIDKFDIIITSYTLLQKDIEFYKTVPFGYAILDEAQHIKNRSTRNAVSVKLVQARHRLILTGTPIENSLDELWSLFDFLMPGLLSSYDRFMEKYIRQPQNNPGVRNLDNLRRKVAPFVLRRMKSEVLDDLPPISEIIYHCNLSDVQQELYRSYAASAREELSQLVKKEGFDRVQIHVLATLTRLKQICCHPAIFAKDKAETGDSAKYEMLLELLQNLMEGRHKTVIFSQYTRMLNILSEDLTKQGIRFEYLDGSSKNRLSIVKKFNEDQNIPIFLVSLKAGGSGLNLVGADTVIHYDMWWNPAVESQATDRVHRIGQKNSVSSYKLITLNTIEEKIMELHKRKKGLVKEIISRDEDMLTKLTWEEVLELLQT